MRIALKSTWRKNVQNLVTLDFETYYDTKLSLTKLTTMDYVKHEKFKVWGVGIKINDEPTEWFGEDEVEDALHAIDWNTARLVCHNTPFDGYILTHYYKLIPAYYCDTAAMARGANPGQSARLKDVAERLFPNDPSMRKGDELVNAKGIYDLPPDIEEQIAGYCIQDVDLTYAIYNQFMQSYPESEMDLIDLTTRMFCEPALKIDRERLTTYHEQEFNNAEQLIAASGYDRKQLASNPQFVEIVESLGITVPTKPSPSKPDTSIPALGKNDAGFKQMAAMYPEHKHIWDARVAVKSRLTETRSKRFLDAADNNDFIPAPLRYYAAHTGRFGGTEKLNMQNLPRGGELRQCLMAPEGYLIYVADLSNIEARMLAWLAGEDELVEQFRRGDDIYSNFASVIYDRPIDKKKDPIERFVGKTCLSASTRVLTRSGWKPILAVTINDELWDGIEWVKHQGVSYMGQKQTINLHGLELTTDHEILTEHTKWETAQSVLDQTTAFQSAVTLATSSLLDMKNILPKGINDLGDGDRYASVSCAGTYHPYMDTTYGVVGQSHAINARKEKRLLDGGGSISQLWKMTPTGRDYLTGYLQPLLDAITKTAKRLNIMGNGVLQYATNGERIEQSSLSTYRLSKVGTTQNSTWIGSILIKDTLQTISDLFLGVKTYRTNEESKILKPVYDILNAGSRHRFTVLTNKGPIIVHNCVLGLGYGMGAEKFQATLKSGAMGPPIEFELQETKRIVNTYRSTYPRIKSLWTKLEDNLRLAMHKDNYGMTYGPLTIDHESLILPNGMALRYHNLRTTKDGLVFDSRNKSEYTYGGKITENVVQALSRIVITDSMLRLSKSIPDGKVALTVHDEIIIVAPDTDPHATMSKIIDDMCQAPSWCSDIPLDAEGGFDIRYSK